jgi:hypothetical protein
MESGAERHLLYCPAYFKKPEMRMENGSDIPLGVAEEEISLFCSSPQQGDPQEDKIRTKGCTA